MPILFCERCGKETEWVYLGNEAVYCKSCGRQMSVDEFRAYRSRVLRAEFEKFLEAERKKDSNPLEELYDELEALVQSDEELAEAVHKKNMKELEKLVNKASRRRKRTDYVLGAVPL